MIQENSNAITRRLEETQSMEILSEEEQIIAKEIKDSIVNQVILIGGPSGTGKSIATEKLLLNSNAVHISGDSYYHTAKYIKENEVTNFDNPGALEEDLFFKNLLQIFRGEETEIPIYSKEKNNRTGFKPVTPQKTIIIEGLYAISWYKKFLEKYKKYSIDETIKASFFYVDVDQGEREKTRKERDRKLGRTEEKLNKSWNEAKAGEKTYIEPDKYLDDVIYIYNSDITNKTTEITNHFVAEKIKEVTNIFEDEYADLFIPA